VIRRYIFIFARIKDSIFGLLERISSTSFSGGFLGTGYAGFHSPSAGSSNPLPLDAPHNSPIHLLPIRCRPRLRSYKAPFLLGYLRIYRVTDYIERNKYWRLNKRKTRDYLHYKYEAIAVVPLDSRIDRQENTSTGKSKIVRLQRIRELRNHTPKKRCPIRDAFPRKKEKKCVGEELKTALRAGVLIKHGSNCGVGIEETTFLSFLSTLLTEFAYLA
jgi:hypothetical protein